MKTCSMCKEPKSLDVYPPDKRVGDGKAARCRPCRNKRTREHMTKDRRRSRNLRQLFGMTVEQYEEMLWNQDGVCAICKCPETTRANNGDVKRLAVDHCHATGRVRALLCNNCNTAIGLLQDNPFIVDQAAAYLRKMTRLR